MFKRVRNNVKEGRSSLWCRSGTMAYVRADLLGLVFRELVFVYKKNTKPSKISSFAKVLVRNKRWFLTKEIGRKFSL